MSATRKHKDCCGERTEIPAYVKCQCGCKLYYCGSCFTEHELDTLRKLCLQASRIIQRSLAFASPAPESYAEYAWKCIAQIEKVVGN